MDLYLVLLGIAALGVLALVLIVWGRVKIPKRELFSPPLGNVDAIENPSYKTTIPQQTAQAQIKNIESTKTSDDSALESLGFSALDNLLIDPEPLPFIAAAPSNLKVEKDYSFTPRPKANSKQDFIVFYLMAPSDHPFVGYELLQALLTNELRYGEMNIFHRYVSPNEPSKILFSVASAVEPGIFDLANIGGFSCPGLSIFMAIHSNSDPLTAFELLLETIYQLAEDLGGELFDEQRNDLTNELVQEYRTKIISYLAGDSA